MHEHDYPPQAGREKLIGGIILVAIIALLSLCYKPSSPQQPRPATISIDAGAPAPSRSH